MDYILFVTEDSIYGSRTMLIPKDEFLQTRNKDYEIMKKYSLRNNIFTVKDNKYIVENFLERKWNNKIGMLEKKEYTAICEKLYYYIDEWQTCIDPKDENWYRNSIINLYTEYDPFTAYIRILNLRQYNIINSFLYMDIDNSTHYDSITDLLKDIDLKNF